MVDVKLMSLSKNQLKRRVFRRVKPKEETSLLLLPTFKTNIWLLKTFDNKQ